MAAPVDEFMIANIKAARAMRPASRESTQSQQQTEVDRIERKKLLEQRRKRGSMEFLERMASDVNDRRAFNEVCGIRQNPEHRVFLDKELDKLKPPPKTSGPIMAKHSSKILYQGHDRPQSWAPLECY
eukprot:gnl/TRDRNA2_/TRDRNA2_84074_c0_seq1.p2 gnl/TRDRNA2_/TRDRNA2_84074_c0~~gnl/TRDRNA2_/TRDRNA2_84074_c0_seq1.p2  ORF type:complete len:128 (-),score=25.89 gnl/TRDRNA2_/TRDRNA2_84074_c0_seq1:127-510(-)